MKLTKLTATDVHGYLPISLDFFEDLTFLVGVNGSGKTSALRILMALLTPNLEELSTSNFSSAAVTVNDDGRNIVISAEKTSEGIDLAVTGIPAHLTMTSAEMQLLSEHSGPREEIRSPVIEKFVSHDVFRTIARMSTPMFLGLDRRFAVNPWDDAHEARRREFMTRRLRAEDPGFRSLGAAGLADVHHLVLSRMQEIRADQEAIDQDFRTRILARAFEYKPSDIADIRRAPSWGELSKYRQKLADIERAAVNLKLPVPELKETLTNFFDRMTKVVTGLEQSASTSAPKGGFEPGQDLIEWIINKPQAERILEHLKLLEEYGTKRADLHSPMDRFLSLVNGFLTQTKKELSVSVRGELVVMLGGEQKARPITSLSSGERQILVMLAHLALNRNLAESGVFIVDEPELSLHIDWQERFVDAIREANPTVQLIMATHSPAIILDRHDHCSYLSA